jgi:hypothetical protein
MSFYPRCEVSRSYALIGFPFAALGFVLGLMGQGKPRPLLAMWALAWYLLFAASIPTSPSTHVSRPSQAGTKHGGCQSVG